MKQSWHACPNPTTNMLVPLTILNTHIHTPTHTRARAHSLNRLWEQAQFLPDVIRWGRNKTSTETPEVSIAEMKRNTRMAPLAPGDAVRLAERQHRARGVLIGSSWPSCSLDVPCLRCRGGWQAVRTDFGDSWLQIRAALVGNHHYCLGTCGSCVFRGSRLRRARISCRHAERLCGVDRGG